MNGSGLQVTITVNAAGAVATANSVANTGTGYITGDQVMVLVMQVFTTLHPYHH